MVLANHKLKLLEPIPQTVHLCKEHYIMVYKSAFPTQTKCITCGISLKHTNPKICPSPKLVEEHLRANTGFEGSIKENDRVCYSCYRSHLVIIHKSKCISNDFDLEALIDGLHPPTTVNSLQEGIDATMTHITKLVGTELLSNSALLLPTIHGWFCNHLDTLIVSQQIKIDDTENVYQLVRARWILSNLTVNLHHHMSYTCTTRKFGTLIYRSNSDLAIPLAQALWKQRNARPPDPKNVINEKDVDTNTFHDFNACIHSQIQYWLSRDKQTDPNSLNIDKWISETDTKLWAMVCSLTKSKSEKRGTCSSLPNVNSPTAQTKNIRRFFILCLILFCTDDRCSYPMHILLSDIIDGQGGSVLLTKVMNRVGVCSSSDSLSRFIDHTSKNMCLLSNKPSKAESFTIVSADDYLHSYARIQCYRARE